MSFAKVQFMQNGFTMVVGSLLLSVTALASNAQVSNVTVQDLNQNTSNYVGKQVSLNGHIDRVLGNGAYIVADSSGIKGPDHRVMILISTPPVTSNNDNLDKKQKAGTAVINFKEGDAVQLNGKAEEFGASSEVDTFSPKSDTETVNETAAMMPVVVIQPGNIHKS